MGDPNPLLGKICRFLTHCRRTWAGESETSQHVGDDLQLDLPDTRFLGLLHGTRQMPAKCRVFLGFVNILVVAIVVGLALENTSPDDQQLQKDEDDHAKPDQSEVKEQDQHTGHGNQTVTVRDSTVPGVKEEVETPAASEPREEAAGTSTASDQYRSVCDYCTALAKKAVRLLTECGYSGDEEHTARPTNCMYCGYRVDLPPDSESVSPTGNNTGAGEGEFEGRPTEHQPTEFQHTHQTYPEQTQVTCYWRDRVLDILAPSLPPLQNLFPDSENMSETVHNTGGFVEEEGQGQDEVQQTGGERVGNGGSDQSTRESSNVLEDEAALDADSNLETILENEENDAEMQRARTRTDEMDDSLGGRYDVPQTRVQIHFSAPCPHPGAAQNIPRYPGSLTVRATRPASIPGADRNDSHSNTSMPHSRTYVVTYTPASQPTETIQPEFSNAPLPEYYNNNRFPQFTGALSHGGNTVEVQPQYSSTDDDENGSQSSSSSTPVPSGRPRLHSTSIPLRDRFRPRGRILARRPRCGLRMMKVLRDDPASMPEEGKTRRQPGREDKHFSPRRGDVICRHTVVPGRGVVEVFFPGLEQYLQDGDSLVRLKMDNVSYPTMLILSAKAYLFLQGRWMYLGRHQHGVRKPKKERLGGELGRNLAGPGGL